MKLAIKVKLPKGRVPHRPTKVERKTIRYDRKRGKQAILKALKTEDETH
jgi:hypothetical protein